MFSIKKISFGVFYRSILLTSKKEMYQYSCQVVCFAQFGHMFLDTVVKFNENLYVLS